MMSAYPERTDSLAFRRSTHATTDPRMNAAQPKPTTPSAPVPGEVTPPVGKDTSAQIQRELEDNSLYNWLRDLPKKFQSGQLGNPKILGGVLLVALAGGVWWWFSGESKKTEADRWKETNGAMTRGELDTISKNYPNSTQSLIARRNAAEIQLGIEGTAKLDNGETRLAAIDSIEKAREEFLKLAEDFKKAGDKTLWAKCLRQAAEAEESLIGIPKAGVTTLEWDESQDRGTVAKAAGLYTDAAKAIGESTAAGERYTKLAQQLQEKSLRGADDPLPTPRKVGMYLHQQIKAKVVEPTPKTPDKPLPPVGPIPGIGTEPKTPDKPLDPNMPPPTGTGTTPKTPDKPLNPTPPTK